MSCLGASSAGRSPHVVARHHGMVLMPEIMAVQDVPSAVAVEAGDDPHGVSVLQPDRVLPALLMRMGRLSIALHDLELNKMNVHGLYVPPRKDSEGVSQSQD